MFDYAGLRAVAMVLSEGSFERAAERLSVSPSAVSQRVRHMEEMLGAILIVRGQPCTPTEAGLKIWRHVEQVAELEADLATDWPDVPGLAAESKAVTIRIAVNADSLAAWLMPAVTEFCRQTGHLVDIALDDQDHTAEWLKSGAVVAAVTAQATPVPGCRLVRLGALRYRATASPAFRAQHFAGGVTPEAVSRAPALIYNRKDRLQHRYLESRFGLANPGPSHWLPSSQAFVEACLAGMGWGMNPASMVDGLIAEGRLVELITDTEFDVPLVWQVQRRSGAAVDAFGHLLRDLARKALVQPSDAEQRPAG